MTDREEASEFYLTEVFPRSCYRIRLQAPEQAVSLLLVPVGTQPYAPTLACLGRPAEDTVLLFTEASRKDAQWVTEAFGSTRRFHKVKIDENDTHDIVRKVQSAYDALGQAKDVICDITGGTKVMTATLAGIAALNGWRKSYVKSQFVQQKGSHHEEIVEITSFFEALGGWHRVAAWKLAGAGNFAQARRHLEKAADDSVASAHHKLHLRRFALAQAYREGRWEQVVGGVAKVAKAFQAPLPPATLELMAGSERSGLAYWACRCLQEEGQTLAAWALLQQAGIGEESLSVKEQLHQLSRERGKEWCLKTWKPVEDFLGRSYSQEASTYA